MLDVCSGNGAIALLAARFAMESGRTFSITATDAACIDQDSAGRNHPRWQGLIDRVTFVSECPVEHLEFEHQSFDLVTSQFGLEYSDVTRASFTLQRVLKPGGRLVMLTHDPDSEIFVHLAALEAEYQQLEELGLFSMMNSFMTKRLTFQQFNRRLRAIRKRLGPVQAERRSPMLASVLGMLDEVIPMSKQVLRRERYRLEDFYIQHHAARAGRKTC